jgi:hypothetical protein
MFGHLYGIRAKDSVLLLPASYPNLCYAPSIMIRDDPEMLAACIELRVAELRLLAAETAIAYCQSPAVQRAVAIVNEERIARAAKMRPSSPDDCRLADGSCRRDRDSARNIKWWI